MAEILSQSQIDNLLSSLISGEKNIEAAESEQQQKKIKEYDFRSPKLFTREQLKILFSIYENYSRILSSYITAILQAYCKIEIIEVEEQQYYEFNNALPDSVLVGLIDFAIDDNDDNEDLVLMDMSKDIGFCAIDRLLGGSGKPIDGDREFTEIEYGLLDYIFKGMIPLMKNSWFDYIEIKPRLMKIETNSRILQGIGADENVVIVVMSIQINDTQGKITICIPGMILDNMLKIISQQNRKVIRKGDVTNEEQRRTAIIGEIEKSNLEVTGVLGTAEVLSKDLIELEIGDVIKLDRSKDALVDITIEDEVWFRGEIGIYNKRKAISIRDVLKKGSDIAR
jgi:flagellar motor switch protein FliM